MSNTKSRQLIVFSVYYFNRVHHFGQYYVTAHRLIITVKKNLRSDHYNKNTTVNLKTDQIKIMK